VEAAGPAAAAAFLFVEEVVMSEPMDEEATPKSPDCSPIKEQWLQRTRSCLLPNSIPEDQLPVADPALPVELSETPVTVHTPFSVGECVIAKRDSLVQLLALAVIRAVYFRSSVR
jgi:hypothetical protein